MKYCHCTFSVPGPLRPKCQVNNWVQVLLPVLAWQYCNCTQDTSVYTIAMVPRLSSAGSYFHIYVYHGMRPCVLRIEYQLGILVSASIAYLYHHPCIGMMYQPWKPLTCCTTIQYQLFCNSYVTSHHLYIAIVYSNPSSILEYLYLNECFGHHHDRHL